MFVVNGVQAVKLYQNDGVLAFRTDTYVFHFPVMPSMAALPSVSWKKDASDS